MKPKGLTLAEIIGMAIVTALVVVITLQSPPFRRAKERRQAAEVIRGARILDAAIDQWAIDNGVEYGVEIPLKALAEYVPVTESAFKDALMGGNPPRDALGNDYTFNYTGAGQLQISATTVALLSRWYVDTRGCYE